MFLQFTFNLIGTPVHMLMYEVIHPSIHYLTGLSVSVEAEAGANPN